MWDVGGVRAVVVGPRHVLGTPPVPVASMRPTALTCQGIDQHEARRDVEGLATAETLE